MQGQEADLWSSGETFRQLVREYLIAGLEKGVPSLFVDVKGLYSDVAKMALVGEVMEDIVKQLEQEKLHDDGECSRQIDTSARSRQS